MCKKIKVEEEFCIEVESICKDLKHTAGLDTIFVQIYMDALPGVPGVSKNQILFFKNESVEVLR